MKKWLMPSSLIAALLMSGCSHKEVYKPENVKGDWRTAGRMSASIDQTTVSGALLENGRVLGKKGELNVKIPEGSRLINVSDEWILTQDGENNLVFTPIGGSKESQKMDLKRMVASASVKDDTVAILFSNNEMALYSLESKKMLMKEVSSAPIAVDARIANPYFLKDLVLFLGLDGKVVIINATTKQVLRSMVVGTEEYFNNIIYLNVINNNLVAATGNSALALSQKEAREKYDIRDIAYTEEGIWLTTKQGEVVALTPSLQLKAKQKFPFAHFVGISVENDRVYVLEKGGYMIALTKNLEKYDVYDVDMDEDKVFVGDGRFYFDDRFINLR